MGLKKSFYKGAAPGYSLAKYKLPHKGPVTVADLWAAIGRYQCHRGALGNKVYIFVHPEDRGDSEFQGFAIVPSSKVGRGTIEVTDNRYLHWG